eukprot:6783305-Alexandrium_andersonii.AAC.1
MCIRDSPCPLAGPRGATLAGVPAGSLERSAGPSCGGGSSAPPPPRRGEAPARGRPACSAAGGS